MVGLAPGPGRIRGYLWSIVRARVAVELVWGITTVDVPVQWKESLERRVTSLDVDNTRTVVRPAHESSTGSVQLIRRWGLLMGSIPGSAHW